MKKNKSKLVKKPRNNWKKLYEMSNNNLGVLTEASKESRLRREAAFKEYKKSVNLALAFSSIVIIFLLVAIFVAQKELVNTRADLGLVGGAFKACLVDFEELKVKYEESYFEVTRRGVLFELFDCCYPVDCAQAVNNPLSCSCTYLLECSGWNYVG